MVRLAGWYLPAIAVLTSLLLPQEASAQFLYVCTVNGRTVTGQLPPQECRNSDVRELNPDGTLHRLIPAPLTPEQRRRRQEEEDARLRQEEAERAQSRKDRSLMETYSSVDEIEAARRRSLAGRQMLIDRADSRIAQYAKERKRLDDEAEFYANREMPTRLKESYASNKTLTEQQEKTRADAMTEMRRINERFDADRKRFEELERMANEAELARRKASEAAQQQQ